MLARIKKLFKSKKGREFIWAVLDSVIDGKLKDEEVRSLLEKFLELLGFQFSVKIQAEKSATLIRANIVVPKWPR